MQTKKRKDRHHYDDKTDQINNAVHDILPETGASQNLIKIFLMVFGGDARDLPTSFCLKSSKRTPALSRRGAVPYRPLTRRGG